MCALAAGRADFDGAELESFGGGEGGLIGADEVVEGGTGVEAVAEARGAAWAGACGVWWGRLVDGRGERAAEEAGRVHWSSGWLSR